MSLAETLLRPVASVLNRRIRANSAALAICQQHAGRKIAVRLSDSALAASLTLHPDGVSLGGPIDDDPDVLLEGNLTGLLAMGGSEPLAPIRDGRVTLHGDAGTAEAIQRLFAMARPDLEDDLAAVFGDTAGRTISEGLQSVRQFGESRLRTGGRRLGEKLIKEKDIPQSDELVEISAGIRETRDHLERLQARVRRLAAQQIPGED